MTTANGRGSIHKEHLVPEISVTGTIGGKEFALSTGKLAGQADGAVVARLGGTEMLVTATAKQVATRRRRLLPTHRGLRGADVRRGQDPRLVLPS